MSGIITDNIGRSSGLVKSAAVSAGLTLVHSVDISTATSTITMDNIFTSTYKVYLIHGFSIENSATAAGSLRIINTSGSIDTGSVYMRVRRWFREDDSVGFADNTTGGGAIMMQDNGSVDSLTQSFWGWFVDPLSTSYEKHWSGSAIGQTASHCKLLKFAGIYKTTGTGVRGLVYDPNFGTGDTIDHGYFRVYGLADS